MNANQAHTLDSLFGPPSEVINVSNFIQLAATQSHYVANGQQITSEDVASQCRYLFALISDQWSCVWQTPSVFSVGDIRNASQETWSNPTLSAYLIKDHDHTVTALHTLTQKATKSSRKAHLPDPDSLRTEVTTLQRALDSITLHSFRYFVAVSNGPTESMALDWTRMQSCSCALPRIPTRIYCVKQ